MKILVWKFFVLGVLFLFIFSIVFGVFIRPLFSPVVENQKNNNLVTDIQNASAFTVDLESKEIMAQSHLVINLNNDKVIFEKNSNTPLPVASLTKLMTAWIVLNSTTPDEQYTVGKTGEAISPKLGLEIGDKVFVKDVLFAMLIGSANDGAVSLADFIETKQKQNFAELMNQQAIKLGMENSHYANSMGFDSNLNYSTANDLAILVKNLLIKYPDQMSKISNAQDYTFTSQQRTYQILATNKLIDKYQDLKAVKTGYTPQALGAMINILEYAKEDYLIIVVGSNNREQDTLLLRKKVLDLSLPAN